MRKLFFSLLCLGALAATAAMSASSSAYREVAGHRFKIPTDYLFDASISWLPAPEKDSFVFLFEPNPNPNQIPKHRVLVNRLSRYCPTEAVTNATQMLRIACGQEHSSISDTPPYEKMQDEQMSWASGLFALGKKSSGNGIIEKRQVAYCQLFGPNPAKPEPTTLCTTFWAYKGMNLQFSFDEKEASEMPDMKARAMALLDQWEVR